MRSGAFGMSDIGCGKNDSCRIEFSVSGMDCPTCAMKIEKNLRGMDGVGDVGIDLMNARVTVTPGPGGIAENDVLQAIERAGFKAHSARPAAQQASSAQEPFLAKYGALLTAAVSGVLIAAAYISGASGAGRAADILYLAAIVTGGISVAKKGLLAVRNLSLDMNTLMTVAVAGAIAIGQLHEGAAVVFLFAVANLLESYSMERARRAVGALIGMTPAKAVVLRGGAEVETAVADIVAGETIVIRPGEKFPLDGVVTRGGTYANQAPITGESQPVEKRPGDEVYAGTLNGSGAVEVRVTRISGDTTLDRIIFMVREAQAEKAPAQRFVERFAKYYTPAVIAGAALVAAVPPLFGQEFAPWFYRALVLLVIACPCALVISTPVAVVSALSAAAKSGVLIKGGAHLETMGRLEAVALDKTGTLTTSTPKVVEVVPADGKTPAEILAIAAALESRSEHHIGKAIVEKAKESGAALPSVDGFESVTGMGARGYIGGVEYQIGSHRLFEDNGICEGTQCGKLEEIEGMGRTVVMLGSGGKTLGLIVIEDSLREGAADALTRIRNAGVGRVVMLTGDNEWTASAAAERLGIDEVRAGLLPGDKASAVKELRHKHGTVAMVGDGVNDAPALAAASVGIAMGGTGTDAALETADIVLMTDELKKLSYTIEIGRKALSTIRWNIFIALLIKAVFLAAAVAGAATLWMAVFADMGASLIVTINGLRLINNKVDK